MWKVFSRIVESNYFNKDIFLTRGSTEDEKVAAENDSNQKYPCKHNNWQGNQKDGKTFIII